MKIVRIIARLNVGGPAQHVVWLTKELQDREFQTVLIKGTVSEDEEDMSYFATSNGVLSVSVPELKRELSIIDIVALWKVYRIIVREKPDIIHSHTAKAGTIGRVAGFFYRWLTWKTLIGNPRPLKLVHTYHGHFFHSYYGNMTTKIFLFIEKILARVMTDKIVVISNQQFDEIHGEFGVGSKKQFAIVPLGINLDLFADSAKKRSILRGELNAGEDEVLVGFVGRLTEIKNVPLLLKVAEIYKNRKTDESPKLKFVIVGDGNLRGELENEAAKLGLNDFVVFVGNRDDTDVCYAGCDLIALTSLNEGTPLSLIEAMANEKSVISTSVGGVIDLLGEIETSNDDYTICERGLRVASGNAEGFYDGLIKLANDADLRNRLGANGKNFVRNNYSKARLVNDISNLYRELN